MKIVRISSASNFYGISCQGNKNIRKTVTDSINFTAAPTKDPRTLPKIKVLLTKIEFFIPIHRITKQSKKMIREISKKYLQESGIIDHNLLTFEGTFAKGYFNPVDSGIVINKRIFKNATYKKFLPEYYDYDAIFKEINFNLPCHESQHKIQATQVYRLQGMQDKFLAMQADYVKSQKELIAKLKARCINDDNIAEFKENIKSTDNKEDIKKFKLKIRKAKIGKKILKEQLKSEKIKLEKFDIEKTKAFYNSVLEKKGFIPKGSEEEAIALKYMEGFATYPQLLSRFQCVADLGSKEAQKANIDKINAAYDANYLEIDAKAKAAEYTEKHLDLLKQYAEKIH